MKKNIQKLAILSTMFFLVGCGGGSNPTSSQDPTSVDPTTADPTTSVADPIPEDEKVHLYIIAGQSGARGKALSADLDRRETLENKEVQILADGYTMPALSNIADTPNKVTYKNMAATFGDSANEFGPELGLANVLKARYPRNDDGDYRSAIIKYTACGSTFYDHWYTESALADSSLSFNLNQVKTNEKLGKEVGPLTNNFYQLLDQGISYFVDNGFDVVIDGIIFSHGEQDAKFDANMEVYEKTLEYFIQDTRNYLGDQDIPFIITEALTNSAKYSNDLRDIQARVAEKTNATILLHSDDLYQNTFEPWHLGARSNVILGERAGATLIAKKDNRQIQNFALDDMEIESRVGTQWLPEYLPALFDNDETALVPVRWEDVDTSVSGEVTGKAIAEYNTHRYEEEVSIYVYNEPVVDGKIDDPVYGKETPIGDKVTVKFATAEDGLYVAAKAMDDDIWTDGEEWKQNDMGQMGLNDDLGIYITDTNDAANRYSIMLSSCDVLRVYDKGVDTTAPVNTMPTNNLHFKNETPNFSHRTLTKGVVNGGECSEITWEMFISYEDLGIENPADLKVFARYSDISSAKGDGSDKVESRSYFSSATAEKEKDIASYIAIENLFL